MTHTMPMPTVPLDRLRHMKRQLLLSTPFQALVVAGLVSLAVALGGPLHGWAVGAGALGWWIALLGRAPVSLVAMKLLPAGKAQTVIVASSGPLEEGVRLGVIALMGASLPMALSIGLGWAAIEVVFAVVNALVANTLLARDDAKAREAWAMLEAQGLLRDVGPHWAVIERVFASLAHIGFTLLAAASPLWLVLTVPAHAGMNLGIGPLVKRSIALAETYVAVFGTALFIGGLWAIGKF
jgi:hypothetical protein